MRTYARETATVLAIVHHSGARRRPSQPLSTVAANAAELACPDGNDEVVGPAHGEALVARLGRAGCAGTGA